jgi:hypothetical protein
MSCLHGSRQRSRVSGRLHAHYFFAFTGLLTDAVFAPTKVEFAEQKLHSLGAGGLPQGPIFQVRLVAKSGIN